MQKNFIFHIKFLLFFLCTFLLFPSKSFGTELLSTWKSQNNLPYALASQVLYTTSSNKIITVSGATTSVVPGSLYTVTNNITGELSDWESLSNIPPSIYWHSTVQKDNNVYLLGGANFPPAVSVDTTYLGSIQNDGSVPFWTPATTLPKPLSLGAAAVIDDMIYFSGGFNQNTNIENDKIYISTIDPNDGSLSLWSEAGSLPSTLSGHGMLAYGNSLYVIGGYNGSTDLATVYKTTPVNGIINSWTPEFSLPVVSYRSSYVMKDNYIFVIGGATHSGETNNQIYYTSIGADGHLAPWSISTFLLPKNVCCGSAAIIGDYLYQIGGYSVDDGYLSDVFSSKLHTEKTLAVPLFKQTDPIWKNELYDSATLWSPTDTKFGSWGCAVTAAAMVFQYNNITRLPDNVELNPGSLNLWLKSQPDGYIAQGYVNWLALSRLSRLAKESGHNPMFSEDALEYSLISGENKTALTNNLSNNLPAILEEPGHFIVAKGTSESTFAINDPYYSRNLLTDGYNDTFLSQGIFTPSHTDLSYLMITGNKNLSMTVHHASVSATSFLQQQHDNDTNTSKKSGESFNMLYFQKPAEGTYILNVGSSTTGLYSVQIYSYDIDGDVKILPVNGIIAPNTPEEMVITYDKNNTSTKLVHIVTFQSTLADIQEGANEKLINPSLTPGLIQLIQTAERLSKNRVTKTQAKQVLKTFKQTVSKWAGTAALSGKLAPILLEDASILSSSL